MLSLPLSLSSVRRPFCIKKKPRIAKGVNYKITNKIFAFTHSCAYICPKYIYHSSVFYYYSIGVHFIYFIFVLGGAFIITSGVLVSLFSVFAGQIQVLSSRGPCFVVVELFLLDSYFLSNLIRNRFNTLLEYEPCPIYTRRIWITHLLELLLHK